MKFALMLMFFVGLAFVQYASGQSKPVDVKALMDKKPGILIDVRTLQEWNSGHHKLAIHHDWNSGEFKKASAKFDKNKTYYLYCAAGGRSGQATEYLKSQGFKNVVNLGGYSDIK